MLQRLRLILVQLLLWLFFFEVARIIFLLYHYRETSTLSFHTVVGSFLHGFRMDLSMSCYLLILPFLFALLSVFIPFFRRALPYQIYSGAVLFFFLILIFTDLEIYNQWGFRLDSTVLQYLSAPKEVIASTGHLPIVLVLLAFGTLYAALLMLFGRAITRATATLPHVTKRPLLVSVVIVCGLGLLIIPIRGGFQMQPMNSGWVYFSSSNFANLAALNCPWSFFQDVMDDERGISNPYQYLPGQRVQQIVDSLYASGGSHVQWVDTSRGKPNVLLILWESFTSKATGAYQSKLIAPHFNRLVGEGIYFSNMYSSGDRTHKGMSAIFSGYPALPNTSIIRFPQKSARLTLFSNLFHEQGYKSAFFYGGDPDYDNYRAYLLRGQFDNITGDGTFDSKEKLTQWGIVDGGVASYMMNDFKNWRPPFLNVWLTLSSHVPYKIPGRGIFDGKDEGTLFLNSIHYTDSVIGRFVDSCKTQAWWKNTLVIITADHGIRFPSTGRVIDDFKIPMLWLGGSIEKNKGMVVDRLISQIDVAATLTRQMGWSSQPFPFSRDITDTTGIPFSFFSNSVSFSLVQPGKYLIYDIKGNRIKGSEGAVHGADLDAAKALQQFIYDDYLKK